MRIIYAYHGKEETFDCDTAEVIVGRLKANVRVDLDLTPDLMVSRPHARICKENGAYWIEDLQSRRGTRVNNAEIKGRGRVQLKEADLVTIGETTVKVEIPAVVEGGADPSATLRHDEQEVDRAAEVSPPPAPDTAETGKPSAEPAPERPPVDSERRLALLYELMKQFGEVERLDELLQLIVDRVVGVIRGARRGALLVKDRSTGKLALKAHLPVGHPAASLTLAQQAMEQRKAFIWPLLGDDGGSIASVAQKMSASIFEYQIASAMYVPLLARGEALGVVCVDNCQSCGSFEPDDLLLLQAVAQLAAMALANLDLQEEWQQQIDVQNNMLKLVPPQIAERLKQQRGRLRLGGEFREATILISDIRGFTNLSATMSPEDVTEMLEDYFGSFVPLVFRYHGIIDKFVGDGILAVYGSPKADEQQHLHAVQTAVAMQAAMREVNARRAAEGKRTEDLGVGVHSGEVVHGLIGTSARMEYTVIGDTVNRASRYCDGARGGEILISPDVHQWIWNLVEAEPTSIVTKHEGQLPAYRVKRLKSVAE